MNLAGGFSFGIVVGYLTWRITRSGEPNRELNLKTLLGIIVAFGGAAILTLFSAGIDIFATYSIGLAIGFFLTFIRRSLAREKIPQTKKEKEQGEQKKIEDEQRSKKAQQGLQIANAARAPKDDKDVPDKPSHLAIGSFGGFEVAYRKNTADEKVIKHSFDNDIFFSGVPEYHPQEGHVIIDIGAHIGTFSLLASSKIGHGKVYAIEASEDSFNILRMNVALNHFTNISVNHLALADKDGVGTLYHSTGNWGHSTVAKRLSSSEQTDEPVECCTLTSFLEKHQIKECQFMKLNCEGSEFPALLSTPGNVLQRFDIMLILYHCDLWSDNTEDDLISHLQSSGFSCSIRNKSSKRGWIIAQNTEKLANNKQEGQ